MGAMVCYGQVKVGLGCCLVKGKGVNENKVNKQNSSE